MCGGCGLEISAVPSTLDSCQQAFYVKLASPPRRWQSYANLQMKSTYSEPTVVWRLRHRNGARAASARKTPDRVMLRSDADCYLGPR